VREILALCEAQNKEECARERKRRAKEKGGLIGIRRLSISLGVFQLRLDTLEERGQLIARA
jgi:hypothetical protein